MPKKREHFEPEPWQRQMAIAILTGGIYIGFLLGFCAGAFLGVMVTLAVV